jgi:hypothetical protein
MLDRVRTGWNILGQAETCCERLDHVPFVFLLPHVVDASTVPVYSGCCTESGVLVQDVESVLHGKDIFLHHAMSSKQPIKGQQGAQISLIYSVADYDESFQELRHAFLFGDDLI